SEAPMEEQSLSKGTEEGVSPQPVEAPSDKPMQPRRHVVQKGDTLWSISTSYLTDPFYWPKVWDVNRFIKNPDLIYPGNVVTLPGPSKEATGALPELPEEVTPPETALPPPPETKIAVEPQVKPTLDPALLASVGYILSGEIGNPGVLVGAKDNRILLSEGNLVYLKPGSQMSLNKGDHLVIYRNIRKIYHPTTSKYLGDLIIILGTAEVLEVDNPIMTAKILKSYNYILTGDPVAPYDAVQLPSFEPTPSGEGVELKGYVVDVKEEKVAIAQFDVVYIDRGIKDGIGRGSSFKVIRDGDRTPYFSAAGRVHLPSRTIGELEVITVGDQTATAKVRKSSEPINRGDRIETLPVVQSSP
ncbi:MAG: LysM peptidoglycan-binding domain-containing protein, partial [Nitrospiria bacterium]